MPADYSTWRPAPEGQSVKVPSTLSFYSRPSASDIVAQSRRTLADVLVEKVRTYSPLLLLCSSSCFFLNNFLRLFDMLFFTFVRPDYCSCWLALCFFYSFFRLRCVAAELSFLCAFGVTVLIFIHYCNKRVYCTLVWCRSRPLLPRLSFKTTTIRHYKSILKLDTFHNYIILYYIQ